MPVPEPVSDLTERTTGPDGVAVIEAFGPDDVGLRRRHRQGLRHPAPMVRPDAPGPKRVALVRPVVALKGRLVPDGGDAALARGWRVRAWTSTTPTTRGPTRMAGYGAATTDDDGRFTIAGDRPRRRSASPSPRPASPTSCPSCRGPRPSATGRENVLEIPIRRAATVVGRVVEHGTGKPVAGMRVHLFRPARSSGADATTDAEGRFSFLSHAGQGPRSGGRQCPQGYVAAGGI